MSIFDSKILLTSVLGLVFVATPLVGAAKKAAAEDDPTLAIERKIKALEKELEEIRFQKHLKKRVQGDDKDVQGPASESEENELDGPRDEDMVSHDDLGQSEQEGVQENDPALEKGDEEAPVDIENEGAESEESTLYVQGRYYLSQQNLKLAQDSFNQIIDKHDGTPESVLARFWVGEMLLADKKYNKAAETLGQAYAILQELKKAGKLTNEAFHGEVDRLPEILAKLAYSLKMVKKKQQACVIIKQLKKDYKDRTSTLDWYVESLSKELKCPK